MDFVGVGIKKFLEGQVSKNSINKKGLSDDFFKSLWTQSKFSILNLTTNFDHKSG